MVHLWKSEDSLPQSVLLYQWVLGLLGPVSSAFAHRAFTMAFVLRQKNPKERGTKSPA